MNYDALFDFPPCFLPLWQLFRALLPGLSDFDFCSIFSHFPFTFSSVFEFFAFFRERFLIFPFTFSSVFALSSGFPLASAGL